MPGTFLGMVRNTKVMKYIVFTLKLLTAWTEKLDTITSPRQNWGAVKLSLAFPKPYLFLMLICQQIIMLCEYTIWAKTWRTEHAISCQFQHFFPRLVLSQLVLPKWGPRWFCSLEWVHLCFTLDGSIQSHEEQSLNQPKLHPLKNTREHIWCLSIENERWEKTAVCSGNRKYRLIQKVVWNFLINNQYLLSENLFTFLTNKMFNFLYTD